MAKEDHVIHLENGCLTSSTPQSKIARMARHAVESGHLIIHFHGGLVSYDSAMSKVERLLPRYLGGNRYPIFFVWESGLLETLTNNFSEIAKERLFRLLWKRIAAIVQRKFNQTASDRSAFILPAYDAIDLEQDIDKALDEYDLSHLESVELNITEGLEELRGFEQLILKNELLTDIPLNLELLKVSNSLLDTAHVQKNMRNRGSRVQGAHNTLMDPRALDRLVDRPVPGHRGVLSTTKVIKSIVDIASQVLFRFIHGRAHGFHATVVEEIMRELYLANVGEIIWSTMKEAAFNTFKDDDEKYGGTSLLKYLAEMIDPETPIRITLVGHSAGAIYISKFIDKAADMLPGTQHYGLIFLAPASTCQLTAETFNKHANLIDGFRMFTMTDELEQQDQFVKIIYPHSLLYFVSGVVEGGFDVPLVGMARFFNREHFPDKNFKAISVIRNYIEADANRAVWSVCDVGPDGHCSSSRNHADFDNDNLTINSILHILTSGF